MAHAIYPACPWLFQLFGESLKLLLFICRCIVPMLEDLAFEVHTHCIASWIVLHSEEVLA